VLNENVPIWLKEGESDRLAFRLSFGHETIETLVAFANLRGGVVLLGISETKEIIGVSEQKGIINQWFNEIHALTTPHLLPYLEVIEIDGKTVVYISVSEYPIKPVALEGKFYKRLGKVNHELSMQEVIDLRRQTVDSHWDSTVRPGKTIADISFEKLYSLIERISSRKQCPLEEPLAFLRKYGLIEGYNITNACWLLFFPEEEQETAIELKRFSAPTVTSDTLTLKSDLFTEVEEAMRFIYKHISVESQTDNSIRWQYPPEAIRELVINMIIHRDYTVDNNSIIKIFDGYIEFYNSGAFPDDVRTKPSSSEAHFSQLRNPQIAELFKEAGMFEVYGSGIKQIRTAFLDVGLRLPEFVKLPGRLIVNVFGSNSADLEITKQAKEHTVSATKNDSIQIPVAENTEDVDDDTELYQEDELADNSFDRERQILQCISKDNRIPLNSIAKELAVSKRTILRAIKKMKEDKIIERIGSEKNGFWRINLDPNQNE